MVYTRGGEPAALRPHAAFYVLKCGLLTESKFYRTNPFIFINTFLFVFYIFILFLK
jgi:hypothetical protein